MFIVKGYRTAAGGSPGGERKKVIAPSREKENKAGVRRHVSPNFRLNDDGFSEIAISADNLFAKYLCSYITRT